MKFTKKNLLSGGLAVVLAVSAIVGGGTFSYLQGKTEDTVNDFKTNKVLVELTETTGDKYNIVPGTTQPKDPKVTVHNTLDAYAFVKVTDHTDNLVTYTIDEGWTKLDGYDDVYYREVAGNADNKVFPVLKDNIVSYDAALENSDMLDENGKLKEGITLTFNASAIQKKPFNNPVDAYEEMQPANSTLAVNLTYTQENNPENPAFGAKTFTTADSTLLSAGAEGPYSAGGNYADKSFTFSIKGTSDKDMALTFDFAEKCGENGNYKGHDFPAGFGGVGDTYLLAGTYDDPTTGGDETFELVGDFYPVIFTVTHTKGDKIDFSFTGSLTALADRLASNPLILNANTEYDEEFKVTLDWPWESVATETCYELKDGVKDDYMNRSETVIGMGTAPEKSGGELWTDFEVMIKKA